MIAVVVNHLSTVPVIALNPASLPPVIVPHEAVLHVTTVAAGSRLAAASVPTILPVVRRVVAALAVLLVRPVALLSVVAAVVSARSVL